jgi:protein involved in polysaccharide export with SLBB domain
MTKSNKQGWLGFLGLIILFISIAPMGAAQTDSYLIGPGDVLEIRFWQDHTLDATVRVRQDGKIDLDVAGEIDAAGITTAELERKIVKQISRYNSAISQAVVRVTEYNNLKVFLSGQIRNPGKYTFEKIPDLWTIINEAGGVTEFGDLSRVLIISGAGDKGKVDVVNVSALVTSGKMNELPEITSGETIEIPRTPAGLPGTAISDKASQKNLFYAVGEVGRPGPVTLEKNIDLMDAIALAGGPTEYANLKNVSIISKDGYRTQIMKVNLKKYQETGRPGRYFIRPEDTIVLSRRSRGFLGIDSFAGWVGVLGALGSVVLIVDRLGVFGPGHGG